MALLIQGKFKDLRQYSDSLYVRIEELCVQRSLGIIKVKLQVFMRPESAAEYRIKQIKQLAAPNRVQVDLEHEPVEMRHLYFFKHNKWQPANIQLNHTLLAFEEAVEPVEIPTFDLQDETVTRIDFDEKGNQILINEKTKKAVKRIQTVRERLIYKINQSWMNQPYEWAYQQVSQSLAETFIDYKIKNI